jgi:glycerol kinase
VRSSWLRDELGIIREAGEVEALAASVPDSGEVVFVPALTGLGAPDWDPHARGAILGITRGTTSAHLARATLDGIAHQVAEVIEEIGRVMGSPITELRADGGATRNDLLMQIQADLLGVPVLRSAIQETTALGAAYLAGIGAGVWSSLEEVASLWQLERRFEPRISADERATRHARWRKAVERAKGWAE